MSWRPVLCVLLTVMLMASPGWATLACDGVDDHLTTSGVVVGATVTLTAWFQDNGYDNWSTILANAACTYGWYEASWLQLMKVATPNNSITNATAISLNTWHHIALVVNAEAGTWYLDGVANGTATGLQGWTGTEVCSDPCSEVFHGMLAEIRVFSEALSVSEIASLASNRAHYTGVSRAQTVYWVFDQCTDGANGNAVAFQDRSGNGNTLTADDGANNTGMTCSSSFAYPWGAN